MIEQIYEYHLMKNNEIVGYYDCYFDLKKESNFIKEYIVNEFDINEDSFNKLIQIIESETVSILNQIEVDSDHRGNGYGKELLNNFFIKNNTTPIILIADSNGPNFLIEWYESFDFEIIDLNPNGHHLMLWNP